jgi:hypothetical protein
MTKGRAPGTSISTAQSSGTLSKPISLAAAAGKVALRSGVAVRMTEIISGRERLFSLRIAKRSSFVAALIDATEFSSAWIAPRIARTDIRE